MRCRRSSSTTECHSMVGFDWWSLSGLWRTRAFVARFSQKRRRPSGCAVMMKGNLACAGRAMRIEIVGLAGGGSARGGGAAAFKAAVLNGESSPRRGRFGGGGVARYAILRFSILLVLCCPVVAVAAQVGARVAAAVVVARSQRRRRRILMRNSTRMSARRRYDYAFLSHHQSILCFSAGVSVKSQRRTQNCIPSISLACAHRLEVWPTRYI